MGNPFFIFIVMEYLLDLTITFPVLAFLPFFFIFVVFIWNIDHIKPSTFVPKKHILALIMLLVGIGHVVVVIWVCFYYNPTQGGYGKIETIHHTVSIGDKLLLHDKFDVGKSKMRKTYVRLSVIDTKNGLRLYRGIVGEQAQLKLIGLDTAWYICKKGITIFDLKNYKIIKKITENDLKKIIQFKAGFSDEISFKGKEMEINTLDGYTYWFEPINEKVRPKPSNFLTQPLQQYTSLPGEIAVAIDNEYYKIQKKTQSTAQFTYPVFKFSPSNINTQRQIIINTNTQTPLNPQISFLMPTILHTAPHDKLIVVHHNHTIEKHPDQFILSAIDFNGKIVWEKILKDMPCYDMFTFWRTAPFKQSVLINQNLILIFGGFVYNIDIKTGKIIWEQRY